MSGQQKPAPALYAASSAGSNDAAAPRRALAHVLRDARYGTGTGAVGILAVWVQQRL
ncbi:hypothetical protein [Streptomyces sp. NBC_01716]|uniref:hypothetical protein n=1 Tax=Streptomyces sp. NBC_01716 TaxID=2975917 RepID=UPI002E32C163|nr:hypothetical protein [Streptomyces sp. NBC_01716]